MNEQEKKTLLREAMAKRVFKNKAERKNFKKFFKRNMNQFLDPAEYGIYLAEQLAKENELNTERWEYGKKSRARMGKSYISFEMEYGASNRTYKGKRCTRHSQYKKEGVVER